MRCVETRYVRSKPKLDDSLPSSEWLEVPCGRCYACRMNRTDMWIDRIEMEMRCHSEPPYFLTLTYDNEHVPISESGVLSLSLRDIQQFFKRLRYHLSGCRIRYIYVGEYGGRTARPHYHAIIFGLPRSFSSQDLLERIWGLGHVRLSSVNSNRIAYVAAFHIHSDGYPAGSVRPFVQYSRRPGLGYGYTEKPEFVRSHVRFDVETGEQLPAQPADLIYVRRSGEKRPLPPYVRRIFFPDGYPLPINRKSTQEYLESLTPGRYLGYTFSEIKDDYASRLRSKVKSHGKHI